MDPISIIALALVAGAVASAKDVAAQAVKDGYAGLKALIVRKFGSKDDIQNAVEQMEKKPDSEARQSMVKEELRIAGADQDEEMLKQAQALVELLKQHDAQTVTTYSATLIGDGAIAQGTGAVAAGKGSVVAHSIGNDNVIITSNNGRVVHAQIYVENPLPPLPEISLPPKSELLPNVTGFIGREVELTDFASELARSHLVIMSGMPGVGKTWMAAALAGRVSRPEKIFWHRFLENEGITDVIRRLAGFLHQHGQKNLWIELENARLGGRQLPPPRELLDHVSQMIYGKNYLFCFDDCQFLSGSDSEQLYHFVQRSLKEASFIIISHGSPNINWQGVVKELTGLNLADTRDLLVARGLLLPNTLVDTLYDHTDGNALFLTLAIDALLCTDERGRANLIAGLSSTDDLKRYLLSRVDSHLTPEERSVMESVAVLFYPGTQGAIEHIVNQDGLGRILIGLCNRCLLTAHFVGAAEEEYTQHGIVRAFYNNLQGEGRRQGLHHRAAEYYETKDDMLKASLHFEQTGEYERAARLATQNATAIINESRSQPLGQLLQRLTAKPLDTAIQAQVNFGLGIVLVVQGKFDEALEHLKIAYDLFGGAQDQETALQMARVCYEIQRTYELKGGEENLVKVIEWESKGLALLPQTPTAEAAMLHAMGGDASLRLRDSKRAEAEGNQSLDLAKAANAQSALALAHRLLSLTSHYNDDLSSAMAHCESSIEICKKLSDWVGLAKDYTNQGVFAFEMDNWLLAQKAYLEAVRILERVGDRFQLGRAYMNLGDLFYHLGEIEQGLDHAKRGLDISVEVNASSGIITARAALAALLWRRGNGEEALTQLLQARQLAEKDTQFIPMVGRWLAQVYLTDGNVAQAETEIQALLPMDKKDLADNAGPIQCLYGQVLAMQGKLAEAVQVLQVNLDQLEEEQRRYQSGSTLLALANVLAQMDGRVTEARSCAERAREIFANLGAKIDLQEASKFLERL